MSLRSKTILIIVVTLLILTVGIVFISTVTLSDTYADFENETMRQYLSRVHESLSRDIDELTRLAIDYAYWDDTYEFIIDLNENYQAENQTRAVMDTLNMALMMYFDTDQNLQFARAYPGMFDDLTPAMWDDIFKASPDLFTLENSDSVHSGLMMIMDQPMIIASSYILNSERNAEPRGIQIFGRALDATLLDPIAESLGVSLSLKSVETQSDDLAWANAEAELFSQVGRNVLRVDETTQYGYSLLTDIDGVARWVFRVSAPRTMYQRGEELTQRNLLLTGAAGVIFGIAMIIVFNLTVLRRLSRLIAGVRKIGEGEAGLRLEPMGNDELGELGSSINHMLTSLSESRETLSATSARLSAIVKSSPLALWVIDRTGTIILFEGKGQETLKIDGASAIGKRYPDVFHVYPQFVEEMHSALAGTVIESVVPFREHVFDTRYTPLGTEKNLDGVVVVAVDVTARRHAEVELEDVIENLDKQNRELERLHTQASSAFAFAQEMLANNAPYADILEYLQSMKLRMDSIKRD